MAIILEIALWPGGLSFNPQGDAADPSSDSVEWYAVDLDPDNTIENELRVVDTDEVSSTPNDRSMNVIIIGTQTTEAAFRLTGRTSTIDSNTWERPLLARLSEDGVMKLYGPLYLVTPRYRLGGQAMYECALYGGNAEWQRLLRNITLRQVVTKTGVFDFPFSYTEIKNTYQINAPYVHVGIGANKPIYYPLINYGTYAGAWVIAGKVEQGVVVLHSDLRPLVYARFLIEAAFSYIGYRVESAFFRTEEFNRVADYVLTKWDEIASVVLRKSIHVSNLINALPGTLGSTPSAFENIIVDNEGRWNTLQQTYRTPSGTIRVLMNADIEAQQNFQEMECRIMYFRPGLTPDPLIIESVVWSKRITLPLLGDIRNFYCDTEIETKESGILLVTWIWNFLSPPSPHLVAGSFLRVSAVKAIPSYADTVNPNWISQDAVLDYLAGCFHSHNLIAIGDPVRRLIVIEPFPDFYVSPDHGRIYDWTLREDTSREREIEGRETLPAKLLIGYDTGDTAIEIDNEGRDEDALVYSQSLTFGNKVANEFEEFINPYFGPTSQFRDERVAWVGFVSWLPGDSYWLPGAAPFIPRMWDTGPPEPEDGPGTSRDQPGSNSMEPGPRRLYVMGLKEYESPDGITCIWRYWEPGGALVSQTNIPIAVVFHPWDSDSGSLSYADEDGDGQTLPGLVSRFFEESIRSRAVAQTVKIPLKLFTADPQIISPRLPFRFGYEFFRLASIQEGQDDTGVFVSLAPRGKPWNLGIPGRVKFGGNVTNAKTSPRIGDSAVFGMLDGGSTYNAADIGSDISTAHTWTITRVSDGQIVAVISGTAASPPIVTSSPDISSAFTGTANDWEIDKALAAQIRGELGSQVGLGGEPSEWLVSHQISYSGIPSENEDQFIVPIYWRLMADDDYLDSTNQMPGIDQLLPVGGPIAASHPGDGQNSGLRTFGDSFWNKPLAVIYIAKEGGLDIPTYVPFQATGRQNMAQTLFEQLVPTGSWDFDTDALLAAERIDGVHFNGAVFKTNQWTRYDLRRLIFEARTSFPYAGNQWGIGERITLAFSKELIA